MWWGIRYQRWREGVLKVDVWPCQWMDKDSVVLEEELVFCFVLDMFLDVLQKAKMEFKQLIRYIVWELRGEIWAWDKNLSAVSYKVITHAMQSLRTVVVKKTQSIKHSNYFKIMQDLYAFFKTVNKTLDFQQYFLTLLLFTFPSSVFIKCSCSSTSFFKTSEETTS